MLPDPAVRSSPLRWLLLALVAVLLLLLTIYDERARGLLTQAAEHTLGGQPAGAATGPALTKRNLPAMVSFGLLYVGLTIALLHLALHNPRQTRWVLLAYAGAFATIAVLLVLGKVLGLTGTLTPLARELIDGLLSPLPFLLLLAVFRLAPRT